MLKLTLSCLSFGALAAHSVVFSGSGNCDGSDIKCKGQPPMLAIYSQDSKGGLTQTGSFSLPDGGLPSWTRTSNDGNISCIQASIICMHVTGRCLFVTVTGGSDIISYSIESNATSASLKPVSTCGTGGENPVYIDQSGDTVFVANYHGPDDGTNSTGAGRFIVARTPTSASSDCYSDRDFCHHGWSALRVEVDRLCADCRPICEPW